MTPANLTDADTADVVSLALRRAYQLGQRYWQQADSESYSQNKKADDTEAKFDSLVDETRAAVLAATGKFEALRAHGLVDADNNLDCWDTPPFDILTEHVAALNEKDPASMWRTAQLYVLKV